MSARAYPPVRCSTHTSTFLVDVANENGMVTGHRCPRCEDLVLVDTVRQLYVPAKKASGK